MRLLVIVFTFLISSCGGGGGGGSSDTPPIGGGSNTPTITVSLSSSSNSVEVNSSITLTWSSTSATSCSASGGWTGSKSTSGSESITIGTGGSNNFSLTCSASGANSGSASVSVTGIRYLDGLVFDGYIRGAEVFIDQNNNFEIDGDETTKTTDNNGAFENLLFAEGNLISIGGFDLDTGADLSSLTLINQLNGYEEKKIISPFTTIMAYMDNPTNLNQMLGINNSINLMKTDPIPFLGEGIYNYMYEKGNQLTVLTYSLQNFYEDGNSEIYFQAIASKLEDEYSATQSSIDIESSSFIGKVIDEVEEIKKESLDEQTEINLNTVIGSILPVLSVSSETSITTAVQRFAFTRLQSDLKDPTIIANTNSVTLQKYQNNVYAYIASDQGIDESNINPNLNPSIQNQSPIITSENVFNIPENQTSIGTVTATDLDGDSLTFLIEETQWNSDYASDVVINISSDGILSFQSAPDYESIKPEALVDPVATVTVSVSDGAAVTSQIISITITNLNDSSPGFDPMAGIFTFSVDENQNLITQWVATDADNDLLQISISGSDLTFIEEVDSDGTLSGRLEFISPPDYETQSTYTAVITVSDGTNSTSETVTININNVGGIYENGIAGAISTTWNKGVDFDKSGGNTFARVPEITNRYTIFSKSHSNSIATFQPWGTAITFRPDSSSTNQRLIQISSEDFTNAGTSYQARVKDQGYLSIEGDAIKLRYRFLLDQNAAIGDTANVVQFTSNSILTTGNWYSLFIYFDGDNDQGGFDSSAFKIYLVSLTDGTLTDLTSNGTWVETMSINPSVYTFWNWEDYEIGSENFDGIIAAFSATTYKASELPSNDEIRTMALDPIKWLNDYKVNSTYRTVFNRNQDPIQSEDGVFSLNSDEESYATQVFLMGDGGTDTASTIYNQVHTGGSANLSLLNSPSTVNISID